MLDALPPQTAGVTGRAPRAAPAPPPGCAAASPDTRGRSATSKDRTNHRGFTVKNVSQIIKMPSWVIASGCSA